MAASKYDYLMSTDIVRRGSKNIILYPPGIGMIFFALKNSNFQIRFTRVSEPFEGREVAHKHDFDEVFLFVPCGVDPGAYDAETELYVGEEGEKMIINQTCAVHMPAGSMHCPIIHRRVGIPFFFVNCPITPEDTYALPFPK